MSSANQQQAEGVATNQGSDTWTLFGYYCAYFVGILVVMLIVDRVTCLDPLVTSLGNNGQISFLKYERKYLLKKKGKVEEIPDPNAGHHKESCCSCKKNDLKVAPEDAIKESVAKDKKKRGIGYYMCCLCNLTCYIFFGDDDCEDWNPLYVKKLLTKQAYYGIPDDKMCCTWCCCCTGGIWADFVFYLMNHHTVVSMMACSKQNAFSRGERRVAFFVQHTMAFLFASLVVYANVTPLQAVMINVFVITPITLVINTMYYYMLACPCLIHEWQWAISAWCANLLDSFGKCIAYPLAVVAIVFLLGSALINALAQGGQLDAVVRYSYQVHLVSIFVDLFMALILFRKDTYTQYKVLGVVVLSTGTWFKEQCDIFDLKESEHYTVHNRTFLPFLLKTTTWKRIPGVVRPLPTTEGDIEANLESTKDAATSTKDPNQPAIVCAPIDGKERAVEAAVGVSAAIPGGYAYVPVNDLATPWVSAAPAALLAPVLDPVTAPSPVVADSARCAAVSTKTATMASSKAPSDKAAETEIAPGNSAAVQAASAAQINSEATTPVPATTILAAEVTPVAVTTPSAEAAPSAVAPPAEAAPVAVGATAAAEAKPVPVAEANPASAPNNEGALAPTPSTEVAPVVSSSTA